MNKIPTSILVQIIGHANVKFAQGGRRRAAGRVLLPDTLAMLSRFVGKPVGIATLVTLTNISTEGVGLLTMQLMHPGEQFVLHLGPEDTRLLRYVVIRTDRTAEGPFLIGAQFQEVLDDRR